MAKRIDRVEDGLEAISDESLVLDEDPVCRELRAETGNMVRAIIKALVKILARDEDRTNLMRVNKGGKVTSDIELASQDLADGLKHLGLWARKNGLGDRASYAGEAVSLLVNGKRDDIKYASILSETANLKEKVVALLQRDVPANEVMGILGVKPKSKEATQVDKVCEAWDMLTNA